jgi:uncharacterized SAM-binding protein YcdF (DUF218 family)
MRNAGLWGRRALRSAKFALVLLGLVFIIVSVTPLNTWWATILEGTDYVDNGDVLIVLSGSMIEDGTMGWSSYLRATYAWRTYRDGHFKEVLVSGGAVAPTKVPISVAMGEYLKFQGVPAQVIQLETQSRSTHENALYSASILKQLPGSKVLLTSDFHMFRARRAFARVGIQVSPRPIPDVIKRSGGMLARWTAFLDLCEETVKIGYYWVRGWI